MDEGDGAPTCSRFSGSHRQADHVGTRTNPRAGTNLLGSAACPGIVQAALQLEGQRV